MAQHLIDNVSIGWSMLGTDLLDGAPAALRSEIVGGEHSPSSELTDLVSADGSPPERMTVTEKNAGGLDWGYVLHPHGIEVISLSGEDHGPVVAWTTDPHTRFSDSHVRWKPGQPIPATLPPRPAQPSAPPTPPPMVAASATRSVARH